MIIFTFYILRDNNNSIRIDQQLLEYRYLFILHTLILQVILLVTILIKPRLYNYSHNCSTFNQ